MFEKFDNISGIYKIVFPNNKIYIGLSSNIKKRLTAHNKTNDDLPVHRAIKKYGKISEENVEILEVVQESLLREREKYWIDYYKSFLPENGYNLTLGGDGASPGVFNSSAKLNQKELDELIKDLIDNTVFIKDLAKKYNLSAEAISDINQGKRYYNKDLIYPLRKDTRFTSEQMKSITGVDKPGSKFSQEEIEEIVELLKNSSLSFEKIAEKFNCSYGTISHINTGKHYQNDSYTYPIRKKKKTTTKLSQENLNKIYELIQNTDISFSQISRDFNISDSTIGRINSGKYHFDENKSYPLRKKEK